MKRAKRRPTVVDGVRVYRLQSTTIRRDTGKAYQHNHLSVPAAIARLVGNDRAFTVELTDDGILYRFHSGGDAVQPLPAWLTEYA